MLERTLLLAGKPVLDVADFRDDGRLRGEDPSDAAALSVASGITLEQAERDLIRRVLAQHEGNISRVAKALGLSRAALYRRLEKHGLAGGPEPAP